MATAAGSGVPPAAASGAVAPPAAGVGVHIAPPTTTMLLPSNGATQSGNEFLDAGASPNVTKVVFVLTGGFVHRRVISGSGPTLYGWIGAWNTATVPDGMYVLQSVASYANGVSAPSPGITIAVFNGTLRSGGSVDEAWLTGAHPGDRITLMRNDDTVQNAANPGVAGSLGSLIIRDLRPGPGYSWLDDTTGGRSTAVRRPGAGREPPDRMRRSTPTSRLHEGLNYITMRDGIELAATVRYPYGGTCSAASPCPTVIEYSGYNVAGPTDPIPSLIDGVLGVPCTTCGNPNLLPDGATDVGAVVARFAGFATVSLQMRGSGCSGGAFDLFGYPSDYDAYDAVEIIAHQPWVANHKVGMVGISFSGLSQFPAAGTDPPGLAAIASAEPDRRPLLDRVPGRHLQQRVRRRAGSTPASTTRNLPPSTAAAPSRRARPPRSPASGSPGPTTRSTPSSPPTPGTPSACLANQALHDQSQDLAGLVGPATGCAGHGRRA